MISLIIKYTIIEAYKKHLFTLIAVTLIACISLSFYVKNISITESDATFIYFYNAFVRIMSVFILAWYCITNQSQLLEKSLIQLQLSKPISRSTYSLALLLSYILLAIIIAIFTGLPLLLFSEYNGIEWIISFCLEISIAVMMAYTLTYIFKQPTTVVSIFILIYVFSRNAAEFVRHADNVLPASHSIYEVTSLWFIKSIALIVPKLENYANSRILESGLTGREFMFLLVETILYIALLFFITKIEIKKKQF